MKRPVSRICGILVAAALLSGQSYTDADLEQAFDAGSIVIEADDHACYHFDVFLAMNYDQRRRGLMFVRELPRFTGMLFVYEGAAMRSMWMKNTYISLDILFVRGDGVVSSVARDTEPLSLNSIASTEPVNFVLELNAGVTAQLGIGPGSRLTFSSG